MRTTVRLLRTAIRREHSALVIQRYYRQYRAKKQEEEAIYRLLTALRQERAAILIQNQYRAYRAVKAIRHELTAIRREQLAVEKTRQFRAKKYRTAIRWQQAACKIQAAYRGFAARRYVLHMRCDQLDMR